MILRYFVLSVPLIFFFYFPLYCMRLSHIINRFDSTTGTLKHVCWVVLRHLRKGRILRWWENLHFTIFSFWNSKTGLSFQIEVFLPSDMKTAFKNVLGSFQRFRRISFRYLERWHNERVRCNGLLQRPTNMYFITYHIFSAQLFNVPDTWSDCIIAWS